MHWYRLLMIWLILVANALRLGVSSRSLPQAMPRADRYPFDVEWRIPVGCDFSGFFVEVALGYVPALHQLVNLKLLQGRCDEQFLQSKLTAQEAAVYRLVQAEDRDRTPDITRKVVAIEHAEPCKMREFTAEGRPLFVISRAMSEGLLPQDQVKCLKARADEVWVPTQFHVAAFVKSGVPRHMIHVIPESVDATFFDPSKLKHIACDGVGQCLVAFRTDTRAHQDFWSAYGRRSLILRRWTDTPTAFMPTTKSNASSLTRSGFRFLSVFKWESRKGWDILLNAYWQTFDKNRDRGVVLCLRTWKPHWETGPADVSDWLRIFANDRFGSTLEDLAPVELIQDELSREELRRLYGMADAFVLPTRGEGWGLPIMEAMAMALPVIATNYSGPAAFMTAKNAFPLQYGEVRADGKAEPSLSHLKKLMRGLVLHAAEVSTRGMRARRDVLRHHQPQHVAEKIMRRLRDLLPRIRKRRSEHQS